MRTGWADHPGSCKKSRRLQAEAPEGAAQENSRLETTRPSRPACGRGRGAALASLGGQPPLPLPQPSPAEGGAQTATPPGSKQAPASGTGSRVQSPDSRHTGLSAPSLQLPGSL